jgi:hypothetical protein
MSPDLLTYSPWMGNKMMAPRAPRELAGAEREIASRHTHVVAVTPSPPAQTSTLTTFSWSIRGVRTTYYRARLDTTEFPICKMVSGRFV